MIRSLFLVLAAGAVSVLPVEAAAAKPARAPAPVARTIAVLCYHDLSDDPGAPPYTLPPDSLRAHIRRAKAAGWTILPLSVVWARRDRPADLPPKTLVLVFDDGYRSFLDRALPILREERVKATLAVITGFVDHPPEGLPPLLDWNGIRAAEKSGWVEIASHTHDLHRYVPDNPWDDTAPAVTARLYRADERRYENRDEYRERIQGDLQLSAARLRQELGHEVTALAWPYGETNTAARTWAREAGFATTLGLEGDPVAPESLAAGYLSRVMVFRDTPVGSPDLGAWLGVRRKPARVALVDLDDVFDPDTAACVARVERLVARAVSIGARQVVLSTCVDPNRDGFLRQAWFQNHQIPVRFDLWSMVAHKLTQAGIEVWAKAPTLNLSWHWAEHPEWRVRFAADRAGARPAPWYFRLDPSLPEARRAAVDFYTDLAVYLPIRGILFDEDAYLGDSEILASGERTPAAKRSAIRLELDEIERAVRAWRPNCRFGRLLYPATLDRDGTHPDFAQDWNESLDQDEWVMTCPAVPDRDEARWAENLARRAGEREARRRAAGEPPRSTLCFPAYDDGARSWRSGLSLTNLVLGAKRGGAASLGIERLTPDGGNIPEGLLLDPTPSEPRSASANP